MRCYYENLQNNFGAILLSFSITFFHVGKKIDLKELEQRESPPAYKIIAVSEKSHTAVPDAIEGTRDLSVDKQSHYPLGICSLVGEDR